MFDVTKNKIEHKWDTDRKVALFSVIDKDFSDFNNSSLVIDEFGNLSILDIRMRSLNKRIKMGSLLGVPSALCTTKL